MCKCLRKTKTNEEEQLHIIFSKMVLLHIHEVLVDSHRMPSQLSGIDTFGFIGNYLEVNTKENSSRFYIKHY